MKYFVDWIVHNEEELEKYIEFKAPKKKIWNVSSLYMHKDIMKDIHFDDFLNDCVDKNLLFDVGSVSKYEWQQILSEAATYGHPILEVMKELDIWMQRQFYDPEYVVELIWPSDRLLEHRRLQRDGYGVDPELYQELQNMDDNMSFEAQQEEYERLLRKYNMPDCFFPIFVSELDKAGLV